ncbi:hypothetical protein OH456_12495 [Vibrio sp. La 4.2.2]|uniref:hypothetical protein n=1 Tax=Vibrio sp. La 4.2.2 TaxID=2998830 RepID=UPI0022CE1591|nr:hypothetical protein [Vibrio sp. La 4.2.2]MDA0108980.1 hypothetical protein [Vibrio sp. La 4.2.2]
MTEPANSNFPVLGLEPMAELRLTIEQELERQCYPSFNSLLVSGIRRIDRPKRCTFSDLSKTAKW